TVTAMTRALRSLRFIGAFFLSVSEHARNNGVYVRAKRRQLRRRRAERRRLPRRLHSSRRAGGAKPRRPGRQVQNTSPVPVSSDVPNWPVAGGCAEGRAFRRIERLNPRSVRKPYGWSKKLN